MFFYESLTVYQKAFAINRQIYNLLKQNKAIPSYVKNQLGRASLSVMLNIAEGTAKTGNKDKRNFYVIARGSSFECASLIKFLNAEKEILKEEADLIYHGFEEISKMLFVMIRKLSEQ